MEKKVVRLPANGSSNNSYRSIATPNPPPIISKITNNANQQQAFSRSDVGRGRGNRYDYPRGKHTGLSNRSYKGRDGDHSSVQRTPAKHQLDREVKLEHGGLDASTVDTERKVKHGKNANHLLNFSYAPLSSQGGGGRSSATNYVRRAGKSRLPILTKEQFLQANCQFVVIEGHDHEFIEHQSQPDKMVPWEQIEQIRLIDDQLATCPICLDVPVAAKMTKCAHIYCWPCMLHYLSLSDRAWAKCPVCVDAVEAKDLKSVSVMVGNKYDVGDRVTFRLMKRERGSLYVRPYDSWQSTGSELLYNINAADEDIKYSKILSAATTDIIQMLTEERKQLQSLIAQNDTESLEASFIKVALDGLETRVASLSPVTRTDSNKAAVSAEQVELHQHVGTLKAKSSSQLKAVAYSDAFDNEISGEDVRTEAESYNAAPACDADKCAGVAEDSTEVKEAAILNIDRVRNSSSTSSSDSAEQVATELVAADLVLPATGTQNQRCDRVKSKRTEVYYFYQASDGRNIYLHSINTRILAAEYGSLESAPSTLTATIVESEVNSMSSDLRKRLKYLSHLPIHSQFTVCEVALKPPVVSSPVLTHFSEELGQRKKARTRRRRTEQRQQHRAQIEEYRKMGKYPAMGLALDSSKHFPVNVFEFENPAVSAADPPVSGSSSSPSLADLQQNSVPLSTPLSFAQTMRGGAEKASWPKAPTACWPLVSLEITTAVADDETTAPTFKDSFSADFDKMLSELSVSKKSASSDSADTRGKAGKKKRKKQAVVLFNTSGQRSSTNN